MENNTNIRHWKSNFISKSVSNSVKMFLKINVDYGQLLYLQFIFSLKANIKSI